MIAQDCTRMFQAHFVPVRHERKSRPEKQHSNLIDECGAEDTLASSTSRPWPGYVVRDFKTTAQRTPQRRCYPPATMVCVLTLLIAGSLLASCAVFQPIGDFLLENTAPTAAQPPSPASAPAPTSLPPSGAPTQPETRIAQSPVPVLH